MNASVRGSAAHVFVDSLAAPVLNLDDQHHLGRVLRLREGEAVSVSDGRGSWRMCRFVSADALEPTSDIECPPRATPELTIGFALPKAERPEWIVQKLTEIGIDRIVVLHADRSVVRWAPDRADRNMTKLRKVAREASMQSRRLWLPIIDGPAQPRFVDPLAMLAEPGGDRLTLEASCLLIGPEGGWTRDELAQQSRHVSLGSSILRVETAALVAAAQLSALRENGITA